VRSFPGRDVSARRHRPSSRPIQPQRHRDAEPAPAQGRAPQGSEARCERQARDSASCGRAFLDNVGATAATVGWLFGSQHCDRGHPRGARAGGTASGVRQSTRTLGRRQRLVRGAVFHNVGATAATVGWLFGSQHCDRGHPRGARSGETASGVRQSKRTRRS
jgi:hypothetical protein